jgi:drug/metabolite transporter (DMT)-like permease
MGEPATRSILRRLGAFLGPPILFVAIWSSGYIVGDIGTSAVPPFTLLWWRFLIAFGVMSVIALAGRTRWPRRPIDWLHLLVTGTLLQTVQFSGVYIGLQTGVSAGLSSLLVSASPLAIAALAVPLFRERLSGLQWAGLVVGLVGVAVAVQSELVGNPKLAGLVAVLVGLAGFVAGTLYQKRFGHSMDLRTGMTIQLGGALVTTSLLVGPRGGFALPLSWPAVGAVGWLALVCSIGGFALLFALLRARSGGAATSYLFLVPPATALVAVPVLAQPVHTGAVIGIALATAGVALVTRSPEKPSLPRRRRSATPNAAHDDPAQTPQVRP